MAQRSSPPTYLARGLNPDLVHTWAEFRRSQSDSEGFSLGTPVFLPPQNQLPANYIWLCGAVLRDHTWTVN